MSKKSTRQTSSQASSRLSLAERGIAYGLACIVVITLIILVLSPRVMNSGILAIVRFLASLASGLSAYLFLGEVQIRGTIRKTAIRASGGFALFIIVLLLFFYGVPSLDVSSPRSSETKIGVEEKIFPASESENKIVRETLSFLQIKLTLLNTIYKIYSRSLNAANEYLNDTTSNAYETFSEYIQFSQREMHDQLDQNHPLPNSLREDLNDTPLSVSDIAVLYDIVNLDVRELSERLNFLLVLLDPDMPFNKINQQKWLITMREAHKQGVLILSYAVCEFLLPIERSQLVEFRTEFLPKLTAFESYAFDFNLDKTQLKQLQSASENKRNALGDELAKIVGDTNIEAQLLEDQLEAKRKELERSLNGNSDI